VAIVIGFISARTCQTLFQCQCCSSHRGRMPIRNWSLLLLVCCCCYTWHLASAHLPLVPKVTLRISIFCSALRSACFSFLTCSNLPHLADWTVGRLPFWRHFFHLGVGSHLRNVIDSVLTSCWNGGFDQIHSLLPSPGKKTCSGRLASVGVR
jgi:hypothetical protein